jgi:hypothetical protein
VFLLLFNLIFKYQWIKNDKLTSSISNCEEQYCKGLMWIASVIYETPNKTEVEECFVCTGNSQSLESRQRKIKKVYFHIFSSQLNNFVQKIVK